MLPKELDEEVTAALLDALDINQAGENDEEDENTEDCVNILKLINKLTWSLLINYFI